MRFFALVIVSVCALGACVSATPDAMDSRGLQERIVAQARTVSAEDYAYTRTVRSESGDGKKKEERVVIERWDPNKPAEERWKLISIDGQPATNEQLQDYRKGLAKRRQAFYGRVAGYFSSPSTSSVNEKGQTVFRFASLPKESVMVSDVDLSSNSTGELTVDASAAVPFVSEVKFRSTKPTRVKLIAKIERFETTTRYRLMPDGKPVPSDLVSEMSGSMLGQEGTIKTRITYGDYRAVK